MLDHTHQPWVHGTRKGLGGMQASQRSTRKGPTTSPSVLQNHPELQRPIIPICPSSHNTEWNLLELERSENFTFQLSAVAPPIHSKSNRFTFDFLLFNLHSCIDVSWWFDCLYVVRLGFRVAGFVSSPSLSQGIISNPFTYFPSFLSPPVTS